MEAGWLFSRAKKQVGRELKQKRFFGQSGEVAGDGSRKMAMVGFLFWQTRAQVSGSFRQERASGKTVQLLRENVEKWQRWDFSSHKQGRKSVEVSGKKGLRVKR